MAIYYISTTGSDSNNGTSSATPWLTISKGNTTAISGDTVNVAAGGYTFSSMVISKQVTWVGATPTSAGLTTILDGGGAHVQWGFTIVTNQVASFSNFLFRNVGQTSNAAVFASSNFQNTINFTNCIFTNMGLRCGAGGSGFGLMSGAQTGVNNMNLTACLAYNLFTATSSSVAAPIFDSNVVNYTLNNVTIYHSATGSAALVGLFRRNSSPFIVNMKNCISHSTTTLPFGSYTTANVSYSTHYQISSVPTGTGLLTGDPMFIDATNGNFNLQPSSPCSDAGIIV
jgi:hypothetical protein